MHNLFAGFMGMFATFGSFFHGGQPVRPPMVNNVNMTTTATPSGTMGQHVIGRRAFDDDKQGERPFFGTVTSVNGSTFTIQMQRFMMMRPGTAMMSPTVTPPAPKTSMITVDSSTTYTGGSQSDITVGTKIAVVGIGKSTSDTAITAVKIIINPTMPTGFPSGMPRRGFRQGDNKNDGTEGQNIGSRSGIFPQ